MHARARAHARTHTAHMHMQRYLCGYLKLPLLLHKLLCPRTQLHAQCRKLLLCCCCAPCLGLHLLALSACTAITSFEFFGQCCNLREQPAAFGCTAVPSRASLQLGGQIIPLLRYGRQSDIRTHACSHVYTSGACARVRACARSHSNGASTHTRAGEGSKKNTWLPYP